MKLLLVRISSSRAVIYFMEIFPKSGNTVTFKLLTHGDEKKIDAEVKGLKKINPNATSDVTTRLIYSM